MLPDIYTYTVYITLLYLPSYYTYYLLIYIVASAVPGLNSDVALLRHNILNHTAPAALPLTLPNPPQINTL